MRTIMQHSSHTGGSDAILVGGKPHPRSWGTFPRYLARYVRELGVLELADCIHHLTGRPARRLRLTDRGLIREGYHADLVLFDPARPSGTPPPSTTPGSRPKASRMSSSTVWPSSTPATEPTRCPAGPSAVLTLDRVPMSERTSL